MPVLLRLLIVEDSVDDALLAVREFKRAGYEVVFERVETGPAMLAALERNTWDLVIADYSLPQFSGMAALELLTSTGLDIPFFIISGSIGEDLAVDFMKSGASDYLMKGNVKRLIPSVQRELRDAEVRRKRHQAEEALHDSEARKAAIVDAALDSIISIDHAGRIIEFNPQAEKTFGYKRADVIGQPMADLIIPPSLRSRHREALARYLAMGTGSVVGRRVELTGMRSDGSEFPVELSLTSISTKTQPMFTAYLRDLTEQKKQEEFLQRSREIEEQNLRIQEANRLKSEFLANMSHELRTPLNAVIGFAEVLVDGKAGPLNAEQREYLNDILTSGQHLLQLINDVLDLAKIEAGRMELYPEAFSLKTVADEVCTIMRPIAAKRNITINLQAADNADLVTLDLRKLKQVLYNLLSNAVKFSHEEGVVKLAINLDAQEQLQIQVKDSGIGIKSDDLPRIFREFEQLESGASRRFPGTGLGLALTKKIIELHDGAITVQSEFGKGSTFSITMPRAVKFAERPRATQNVHTSREL
ncbi:MAG: ATP-binding protein [Candidatus Binatia bacterium]